LNKLMFKI